MNIVKVQDNLAEFVERVATDERIVLERRGKRLADLVPMEDLELLEELEEDEDLRVAKKAVKEKRSIPLEKIKHRLGMSLHVYGAGPAVGRPETAQTAGRRAATPLSRRSI
jgi:prevent-host-death family protein